MNTNHKEPPKIPDTVRRHLAEDSETKPWGKVLEELYGNPKGLEYVIENNFAEIYRSEIIVSHYSSVHKLILIHVIIKQNRLKQVLFC